MENDYTNKSVCRKIQQKRQENICSIHYEPEN